MSIEVVLAPNPGIYTGPGTNTYVIVADGEALVLDPGPVIDTHAAAIIAAVGDATPVAVVATHTHPDHAPLANRLARRLDVPVVGFGPGPEFIPDRTIDDGDTIRVGSRELIAVHTPGHTDDHLCFLWGDALFTGDHIMSGSTVVIDDAAAYLDSLAKVRALGAATIEPGHGPHIADADAVIDDYIDHRRAREREIVAAVADGARTVGDLVDTIYAAVPPALRPAAVHQVHVQLRKLAAEGRLVVGDGLPTETTMVHPPPTP